MRETKRRNLSKFLRLNKLLLLGLICSFSVGAFAQNKTVTGKVTDSMGEPIPGASISIKGTTSGTITNIDGEYSLSAEGLDKSTIVISFIGMKTEEISVAGKSNINVLLKGDILEMNEVVIVGYGSQQKKDITGSVSLINADDMESRPNTQVGALIMGKAAGVQVLSSSGKPSQGLSIRIRGTNSINASSEPLYVVDGVPTSDTRSISPSDIESISILKDASSCAIYGAQGANGVVIMTTKRGKTDKPRVTIDVYGGYSKVWKTLPVLNGEQYRDLMTDLGQSTDWNKYNKNTDWQKEIFQNGASRNYQISVSGKNENTNYFVSGGTMEQKGAIRSSEMNRSNFKLNLDQKVNNWLSVGSSVAYTKYSDVDVNDNNAVNQGGVLLGTLTTPSVIGIYNTDGTYTSNPFQNWENPVASTDGSDREYKQNSILGNAFVKINPIEDLTFKSNVGFNNINSIYDYFLDPFKTSYGRALKGQGINNTAQTSYYIFDNTLTYNKKINKHAIDLLAGSVVQDFYWENSEIETRNFASDGIHTPSAGSTISKATAYKSEQRNSSFLGRANYAFNDKYLLTANFRADGSSKFGKDKRWGYFPSFSAGWRISQEAFMQKLEFLNDLKLKAGWGIVGNDQINNYAYLGKVGSGANYPIGGITSPGTYPASIENQGLKWEQSEQTNIGVEVAVLNSRIRFSAEAYKKNTIDLLLNAPLPKTTGFDNAVQNIGELENKGYEFSLNTVNVDKAFTWTTDFNISFNKNKVVDIVGQEMYAGSIAGRGEASLVKEGLPLGTLFGYQYGGVDPATGDVYYIDKNGNSTFTPTANDRKVIGDANPDFFYGMTNTVSYKGVSLSIFLEGSQGNDVLNATRFDTEGMTDPKNQSTTVLHRWRNPGDVTDMPRASWGNTNNSRISSHFVEDGSYLRVKTLTLSYNLPKSFLSKINLNSVRFYATGENLLTFTKYSGFDPEVNAFGASNTAKGIDYGTYPQTRNIIFGANIIF